MHQDDNVWAWTLGGTSLIGLAVWSAFVFAHDLKASNAPAVGPTYEAEPPACLQVSAAYPRTR